MSDENSSAENENEEAEKEEEKDVEEPSSDESDADATSDDTDGAGSSADDESGEKPEDALKSVDEELAALASGALDSKKDKDDADTFASDDAPWVGAEDSWRAGDGSSPAKKASTPPEPPHRPSWKPDELVTRDSTLPPGPIGPDSLPALAAKPDKKATAETKLMITAIILAVVVVGVLVAWWMRDKEAESNQRIALLEAKLATLQADNPEDQSRIAQLRAELEAAHVAQEKEAAEANEKAAEEAVPDEAPEDVEKAADEEKGTDDGSRSSRRSRRGEDETAASLEAEKKDDNPIADDPYGESPSPTPSTGPLVGGSKGKTVEELLAGALPNQGQNSAAPPAPAAVNNPSPAPPATALPSSPSREQVQTAMGAVAPTIKRCGGAPGDKIVLKITVAGATGRVMSAHPVSPVYEGTPVGICASRAVRMAKFPKFSQGRVVIKYPFKF